MATLISKNMVVPKGAVRTYVQNTDNYYLAALILGQYEALEGEVYFEPSLINYGEMHLDLGGFNTGTLITISASLQWEYGKVENYGLMSAVVPDALHVGVLGGPGYCPDVYNAGRIIGEAQESATGFGAGDAGHSFTNAATGTVSARSGELSVAVSFHGGGTVINHGRLLAHATGGGFEHIPDQAWGVTFGFGGFFGRPNVTNSGLIQATDDDPGTQHSIGIRIHGEGTANIVNSGTIRGDYAIRKYSDQYTTPYPVTVENSGLIEGRVDLGWGDDVLDNSHRIVGQVELSNGDDVYAGALGTVTGPVYGGAGNDRLTVGAGDELLSGGDGNDTLEGGGGNDRISGGAGSDTASYAAAPAAVTLRLTATGAQATGGAGSDTLSSIENLTGSAFNDRLTGSPAGNVLNGGGGIDTMTGGSGNDSYHVDATADKIVETSAKGGTDTVVSSASFTLPAYVENLILSGTAAVNGNGNGLANAMTGNGAANRLNGGAGSDTMAGGKGNDVYYVDHAGDRVVETYATGGTDRVVSTVSYVLGSNLEHLTLSGVAAVDGTGNSVANAITGNDAANILKGGERNDTLTGAAGNDSLYGGTGNDSLQGDAGADRFYFDTPLSASTNVDRILAFSTVDDSLYLDRDIFKAIAANGTLSAAAFRVGTAAGDSSDRIVYDQSTGRIYYDPDGSGGAAQILFATVAAGTQLTSSDFVAFI